MTGVIIDAQPGSSVSLLDSFTSTALPRVQARLINARETVHGQTSQAERRPVSALGGDYCCCCWPAGMGRQCKDTSTPHYIRHELGSYPSAQISLPQPTRCWCDRLDDRRHVIPRNHLCSYRPSQSQRSQQEKEYHRTLFSFDPSSLD